MNRPFFISHCHVVRFNVIGLDIRRQRKSWTINFRIKNIFLTPDAKEEVINKTI